LKSRFFLVFLFLIPLLAGAQIEKGSIGLTGNLNILRYDISSNSTPFFKRIFALNTPNIDYFLSKNWSVGGSMSYFKFSSLGKGFEIETTQFLINPHVKYGVNYKRIQVFLSLSGSYFKQKQDDGFEGIDELATYVGTGFQWFFAKNVAWENWFQFPFVLQKDPILNTDIRYFSGLKFYLNAGKSFEFEGDLFDYYLNDHNIRFGLNLNGFIYFNQETYLFDQIDWSYQNFFRDYFVFYVEFKADKNEGQTFFQLNSAVSRIKAGFHTYLPLNKKWYIQLTTGLLSTNTDYTFTYRLENMLGYDLGMSVQYFFPKRAIVKVGWDWQNTFRSRFSSSVSNHLPYVGWEIFLNNQVSIEPLISYQFYKSKVETFSNPFFNVEEVKEQNLLFELKLRTLFHRNKGILNF
jgi:hypothetical protein